MLDILEPRRQLRHAQVIAAKELTRYRLQQIVTAREDDLLRLAPPASVADMEQYGRNTAAQLLLLQVLCLLQA